MILKQLLLTISGWSLQRNVAQIKKVLKLFMTIKISQDGCLVAREDRAVALGKNSAQKCGRELIKRNFENTFGFSIVIRIFNRIDIFKL